MKASSLFDRAFGIAKSIARFRNGKAEVLVANVSEEYQHVSKGTTIACLDEVTDILEAFEISD